MQKMRIKKIVMYQKFFVVMVFLNISCLAMEQTKTELPEVENITAKPARIVEIIKENSVPLIRFDLRNPEKTLISAGASVTFEGPFMHVLMNGQKMATVLLPKEKAVEERQTHIISLDITPEKAIIASAADVDQEGSLMHFTVNYERVATLYLSPTQVVFAGFEGDFILKCKLQVPALTIVIQQNLIMINDDCHVEGAWKLASQATRTHGTITAHKNFQWGQAVFNDKPTLDIVEDGVTIMTLKNPIPLPEKKQDHYAEAKDPKPEATVIDVKKVLDERRASAIAALNDSLANRASDSGSMSGEGDQAKSELTPHPHGGAEAEWGVIERQFTNNDNRCFMHAALRCLKNCSKLNEKILFLKNGYPQNSIAEQYCSFLQKPEGNLDGICYAGWDLIKKTRGTQQDPSEFLVKLLDLLLDEDYFEGSKINVRITFMGTVLSEKEERHSVIDLPVKKESVYLDQCLRNFYESEVDFQLKDEPALASKLNIATDAVIKAQRTDSFKHEPPYVIFNLKRTHLIDRSEVKLPNKIKFPFTWSTGPIHEAAAYNLIGVITHQGNSAYVGHYRAYLKEDGNWYRCDNERKEHITENDMQNYSERGYFGDEQELAQIFFYEKTIS